MMGATERLYYHDSRLLEFDAVVISARRFDPIRQGEVEALCRGGGIALSRLRVELVPLTADDPSET